MAAKRILQGPPGQIQNPVPESPWTSKDPGEVEEYPGSPKNKDPRSPSEASILKPEPYPGSGQVNEPWKSAPATEPRRLRRTS